MKPRITKELQETLEHNILIEDIYFEVKTGAHHFNHAKDTPIMAKNSKSDKMEPSGKTILTINGKEVTKMDREDVLAATPDASIGEEERNRNAAAVAGAMVEIFKNIKAGDTATEKK